MTFATQYSPALTIRVKDINKKTHLNNKIII